VTARARRTAEARGETRGRSPGRGSPERPSKPARVRASAARRRASEPHEVATAIVLAADQASPRPRRRSPSLAEIAAELRAPTDAPRRAFEELAAELAKPRKRARSRSLSEVAAQLRAPERNVVDAQPLDIALPARPVSVELIAGRAHYERVIAAIMGAHTSVWIATANVKGMMVEAAPGRARKRRGREPYVSVLERLDELAGRGVELRLLHAEIPSRPFREEIAKHPRLLGGALELARCPRVHLKAVIVDGALLYLGSANWTGAGLGAKGSGKRNFELGIVTDDAPLLDQVQAMFDRIWTGGECAGCKLRDECPGPRDE